MLKLYVRNTNCKRSDQGWWSATVTFAVKVDYLFAMQCASVGHLPRSVGHTGAWSSFWLDGQLDVDARTISAVATAAAHAACFDAHCYWQEMSVIKTGLQRLTAAAEQLLAGFIAYTASSSFVRAFSHAFVLHTHMWPTHDDLLYFSTLLLLG